jgi:hypothetical protein
MKLTIAALAVVLSAGGAPAQGLYGNTNGNGGNNRQVGTGSNPNSHYVAPHFNSNGGFTQGHQSTNPNNTQMDNYSTRGNVNPYTGSVGTRNPRY